MIHTQIRGSCRDSHSCPLGDKNYTDRDFFASAALPFDFFERVSSFSTESVWRCFDIAALGSLGPLHTLQKITCLPSLLFTSPRSPGHFSAFGFTRVAAGAGGGATDRAASASLAVIALTTSSHCALFCEGAMDGWMDGIPYEAMTILSTYSHTTASRKKLDKKKRRENRC